jgi:dTDP-4-amino-4,6-dideoxygalactose transaminase
LVGSIGQAGAFSFNFFKNMSCGEGGAVVTSDGRLAQRARCAVDCCAFYWAGRKADEKPFAASGARASEFDGAVLNAQLDRLPITLRKLRRMKKRILRATAGHCGLTPAPMHSPDHECATTVMYTFPTERSAKRFIECAFGQQVINTGRHTYFEWDPVLAHAGGHHPAMNPFKMPQNRRCRMKYSKDMLPRSLDILRRTVMIGIPYDRTAAELDRNIARIRAAAKAALGSAKDKK